MNKKILKRDVVTVAQFYTTYQGDLELRLVAGANGLQKIIKEPTVNRPGLAIAGFTRYFASKRIQVIGSAESTFLKSLSPAERAQRYAKLFSYRVPCIVYSRNIQPDKELLKAAEKANVPIFRTPLITMRFINLATLSLEWMFAPRGTEMGSMVDILGMGVIVKGESGIGKSECVLALIERGYSLVADDITKVTLIDGRRVVGTSAEVTRDHMEVRGIGIINVAQMFGVKAIRRDKQVDLVVSLKTWNDVPNVDRLGMDADNVKILDVDIPHVTIPVRPGRDIARLVEVAALQQQLKAAGHNAAEELNERLIARMAKGVSL
jgi:HPr kinase/phosphorylase